MGGILDGRKNFLLTIQAEKGSYEAPQFFLCNTVSNYSGIVGLSQ